MTRRKRNRPPLRGYCDREGWPLWPNRHPPRRWPAFRLPEPPGSDAARDIVYFLPGVSGWLANRIVKAGFTWKDVCVPYSDPHRSAAQECEDGLIAFDELLRHATRWQAVGDEGGQ